MSSSKTFEEILQVLYPLGDQFAQGTPDFFPVPRTPETIEEQDIQDRNSNSKESEEGSQGLEDHQRNNEGEESEDCGNMEDNFPLNCSNYLPDSPLDISQESVHSAHSQSSAGQSVDGKPSPASDLQDQGEATERQRHIRLSPKPLLDLAASYGQLMNQFSLPESGQGKEAQSEEDKEAGDKTQEGDSNEACGKSRSVVKLVKHGWNYKTGPISNVTPETFYSSRDATVGDRVKLIFQSGFVKAASGAISGAIGGVLGYILGKRSGSKSAQQTGKTGLKMVVQGLNSKQKQSDLPFSKSVEEKIETNADEITEQEYNASESLLEPTRNLKETAKNQAVTSGNMTEATGNLLQFSKQLEKTSQQMEQTSKNWAESTKNLQRHNSKLEIIEGNESRKLFLIKPSLADIKDAEFTRNVSEVQDKMLKRDHLRLREPIKEIEHKGERSEIVDERGFEKLEQQLTQSNK
ncbi:hypothetical protein FGO68_gene9854 [Halteria grandinella]|uniref:Uncharacterized protein n=1 Tax=Halteria grandinella TaxID=5974 RepID=A0A8J8NPJ1_HALGN|nr:hypothetical protein FGO68_gene9854 [Halteria grandinella]